MNAVAPMLSLSKSLQSKIKSGKLHDAKKIAEGLSMIENTGQGLMAFTEEYRRLSLLPPPKLSRLPLSEALRGIGLLIESEAEKHQVGVELVEEKKGLEITVDPQQLEMILLNLWKNALESFPDGQKDKQVVIRSLSQKGRVWIQVEDNGSGIAPELIDQVFVPFFSTKDQGSGIGLSLSRQIMNNHRGSIHLESSPGNRTVVTLIF
jgi:C4-dicarboxylate-specific signal transduction histidine kinase